MRVLVLGAGGMAGHVIALSLAAKGYSVTGLARRDLPFCEMIVADACDIQVLESVFKQQSFDAVVNCVGVLNRAVDISPYTGIWLNSCLPHLLSELTANSPTRVIHLSTDCVFSGHEKGNYQEDSFRSANTLYGRSKALGELNDSKNLTFRTSIIGPDINENGIGLFNWFMGQTSLIHGYTNAIWTGVTTIVLAEAIALALERNLTGLYHLVNSERISKHELLRLLNSLRTEPINIQPDNRVQEDKSLLNCRTDFPFVVPSYEQMVANMGKWIIAHKAQYTHYRIKEQ
ncbi:dTDP-4-dehydrorhamnose reductase [Desulfitobacterium dichloroeliminans LMG P-21439]|uniref:dTDP-4-dehydrorhamnose reductase n=1 Tax=Desulfitobacterium dichloroeliminans (strain LMG P-21439 / DCA1) TaxID=871963 RepID=L0FBI2_DESDL|nr:sugar nucleotide-binding protein [Desulfitobacterium dichloroeliminans]AGA70308.1 dTDP-4-dehydrorhamnose reductase [Desulfitobacterium dichloroeliminans LMG P-21439]